MAIPKKEEHPFEKEERLSIFELSGKLFGLNILATREVIPLPRFTPLPNSSDIYYGVFNLRGEIFPLADISPVLDLSAKQMSDDDMVIIIGNNEGITLGILVDRIHQILTYTTGQLKCPTEVTSTILTGYLEGVLLNNKQLIHVLDLNCLFKTQQILAHY